ncbi:UNVERIFIED_CONTAM: hypothetical protein GTU68_004991 [Idotea baltica]|nr:hypothetical protein [Idotea baltica]
MWFFGKKNKEPKILATDVFDQNFNELVAKSEVPVLLDFWATWCGPCKVMGPIINELANENKDKPILIAKINTEVNPKLSQHFQIKSIPTIMIIMSNKVVFKQAGMIPKPNLQELIDNVIAEAAKLKPTEKKKENNDNGGKN